MPPVESTSNQTSGILRALNAGSGVDIPALAQGLAEAENQPRIDALQNRKAAAEASISAYGVVSNSLAAIQEVFDLFKNASDLHRITTTGFDTDFLTVTADSAAVPGEYSVSVAQLATARSISSNSFTAVDEVLNGGGAFDVELSIGVATPVAHTVNVTEATPQGVVAAINAADLGVQASLINKSANGAEWYIILKGQTGADSHFTATSVPDLGFATPANELSVAANAEFSINGMTGIQRPDNKLDDVIPGLTVNLRQVTAQPQRITVEQNYQPLRTAVTGLVSLFNDFKTVMDELVNEGSEASELSGALSRDKSLVAAIFRQMQALVSLDSSTPSGGYSNLRDLGVGFDPQGRLELDSARFDSVMAADVDHVVQMLSAGTDDQSELDPGPKGLGLDASIAIKAMLAPEGVIKLRVDSTNDRIAAYEAQLTVLESRLEAARVRYLQQFAAMESFVERSKGVGNYLEGQFKAMENAYK